MAAAVAERLIGWSKLFGAFVAAPILIVLIILGLFGWSKLEDVRDAAKTAGASLQQAQDKVSVVASVEKKVGDLVDSANERAAALEQQLASLQKKTETNSQQIQNIEKQLGSFSAQLELGIGRPDGSRNSVGGKNYGPWRFLGCTAREFVDQPDFPWREDFKGVADRSPEFDAAWSKIGDQEPEQFKETQRRFAQNDF